MTLDHILTGVMDLIPLPKAYLRLRELIADPDSSLTDITQVIANDPGLTSRILRIVNSAYYALAVKVDTIGRAVQVLGLNQVHDLALATAAAGTLSKLPCTALEMHEYWRRSIYAAIVGKLIARRMGLRGYERLFVGGLLHGIGELVLAFKEPTLFSELKANAVQRQIPMGVVQRERLGFDYAVISSELMQQWQLPDNLVIPVRHHATMFATAPAEMLDDIAILHVASVVSRAALWSSEQDEPVPAFEPIAMQVTDLDEESIEQMMTEADGLVIEAMGLLLPDLRAARNTPLPARAPRAAALTPD